MRVRRMFRRRVHCRGLRSASGNSTNFGTRRFSEREGPRRISFDQSVIDAEQRCLHTVCIPSRLRESPRLLQRGARLPGARFLLAQELLVQANGFFEQANAFSVCGVTPEHQQSEFVARLRREWMFGLWNVPGVGRESGAQFPFGSCTVALV